MTGAARTRDAATRMDRMYRLQRLVYDPTRRWYLLGRDRLIEAIDAQPGASVLELACGTGRNLVRIGERYPDTRLFGLDVSEQMLKSARANRRRAGLEDRMALAAGDATACSPAALFAGRERFDHIVCSYALSMIPAWPDAVDRALSLLAPGGRLYVVDFDTMERWPRSARRAMHAWLRWFEVTPRPGLVEALHERARHRGGHAETHSIGGGYARLTMVRV